MWLGGGDEGICLLIWDDNALRVGLFVFTSLVVGGTLISMKTWFGRRVKR